MTTPALLALADRPTVRVSPVIVSGCPDAHQVWLDRGVQHFRVGEYLETKQEADAYADMLRRALAAPQVEMVSELPNVREQFTEWLAHEMPAGTVIGNPRWWAPKIIRAFHDYRTIARERDKLTSPGAAELPDLPDSYGDHCVTDSVRVMREPGYTADQMRAFRQEGIQAALNARAGGEGLVERVEYAYRTAAIADGFDEISDEQIALHRKWMAIALTDGLNWRLSK